MKRSGRVVDCSIDKSHPIAKTKRRTDETWAAQHQPSSPWNHGHRLEHWTGGHGNSGPSIPKRAVKC